MSGPIRRRSRLRLLAPRLALAMAGVALTGSLAAALQVRRVVVDGTAGPARPQVEQVLAAAVGSPTLVARAEDLRATVLQQVSWVADAAVSVSLDGVVHCSVTLRRPAAVMADGSRRLLVDEEGHILGEPSHDTPFPPLELVDFAPHPEELPALLAALPTLEAAWGATVRRVQRLGPRDVALEFTDSPVVIIADPSHPAGLATGRAVLAAWTRHFERGVQRLDVRVPERVAVLPLPEESGT